MARIHVPVGLRWSDLDAYGHVNNAALVTLLEEARIAVFWDLGDADGAPETAVIDASTGSATRTLVARQVIEYLAPIPYRRRPLDVEMWIGRIGGADLEVCYEVYPPEGVEPRVCYARASTRIVVVDAATLRPRRLTDAERAAWGAYVDEPLELRR